MHNIYFTRHGETVWNVENKICGMTDSPLTARGQQQARQLGAPPAGAVLWQIRGHAPGRCGVPHFQDPLCRPL